MDEALERSSLHVPHVEVDGKVWKLLHDLEFGLMNLAGDPFVPLCNEGVNVRLALIHGDNVTHVLDRLDKLDEALESVLQ